MSGIYLGKWRWHAQESDQDESMWIAPAGTISTIDLRPIDQCAAAGSEGGPGLFSCDDDPGPEHDAIALGDNPAMIMSDAIRSEWQARTGASVRQGAAISEAIWDALTVQGAALAVRTGIGPMQLIECPPEVLNALWRVLEYQADEAEKARTRR